MRALKALVIVLGIAVLLGFFGLVGAIVYKLGKPIEAPVAAAPAPPAVPGAAWAQASLDQPAGTRIQSVTASGALIVIHLYTETPGNDERLVVFDPAAGRVVGTVALGTR